MAETILYFAYGSNMLPARLRARCPSAVLLGPATAPGHHLRFWKPGMDGSAKATLVAGTGETPGVLFHLDIGDLASLDRAEGAGRGYERVDRLAVRHGTSALQAVSYMATAPREGLPAFDWYLALVLAGALLHDLPQDHREDLRRIAWRPDPLPDRPARIAGLQALAAHGIADPAEIL